MRPITVRILGDGRRVARSYEPRNPLHWEVCLELPERATILEVLPIFGENFVLRTLLDTGNYAIFWSHDNAYSYQKVFESASEILDVSVLLPNWTIMVLDDGTAYESLTAGFSWDLISSAAPAIQSTECVPALVSGSVVNILFGHTGDAVWRSIDRGQTWQKVADLTAYSTWSADCYPSIKGCHSKIFATCGSALVGAKDSEGLTWGLIDNKYIYDWSEIKDLQPNFRQIRHVDSDRERLSNWKAAQWMLSIELRSKNIIRSYANDSESMDGVFIPIADAAMNDQHALVCYSNALFGEPGRTTLMAITGERTINKARQQIGHASHSWDGAEFGDAPIAAAFGRYRTVWTDEDGVVHVG